MFFSKDSNHERSWWYYVGWVTAVQVLLILYFPCIVFAFQNPASLPILFILLPVCIALYSFVLGSIIYFVCWLKEKDF